MAPEVYKLKRFDFRVDIWSLGCVFGYTLSRGKHPFGDDDITRRITRIKDNDPMILKLLSLVFGYFLNDNLQIRPVLDLKRSLLYHIFRRCQQEKDSRRSDRVAFIAYFLIVKGAYGDSQLHFFCKNFYCEQQSDRHRQEQSKTDIKAFYIKMKVFYLKYGVLHSITLVIWAN